MTRLPLLPGVEALAAAGRFSGGMLRNRQHVEGLLGDRLAIHGDIEPWLRGLLFEAETSGGLVFSVGADRAIDAMRAAAERGEDLVEIGEVVADRVIRVAP